MKDLRHPFLSVYSFLNEDEELNKMLLELREDKSNTDENMIFTFDIGEEYRKRELSPFIRLVPITMVETNWSDDDAEDYELYFSLEVFSQSMSSSYSVARYIVEKYKNDLNCICYSQDLQYDSEYDLYNSFLKFKIIVKKGEI